MAMEKFLTRTVEIVEDGRKWIFGGRIRRTDDNGDPIVHPDDLKLCTATDVQAALRKSVYFSGSSPQMLVSHGQRSDADIEEGLLGPVSFLLRDNKLVMSIIYSSDLYVDEGQLSQHVNIMLAELLKRNRMWLLSVKNDEYTKTAPWLMEIEIGFHSRTRNMASLFNVGLDMLALLDAIDSGNLNQERVADLLRAGRASALIGQSECQWLEVKRQHYDLTATVGKIHLAQAVARFANAQQGGLLVIGLSTKRKLDDDVIVKVTPVVHDARIVQKYHNVLRHHLYPPIDGLQIEAIGVDGGDLILVRIPPQPEESKPFLVHGAIVDGSTEGAFVSIVKRHGDSSIPVTAPMIHSTLVAGRALLRRGILPPEEK